MKTIKARHKLIPALVMLIVAAITMSTASYAWFSMSNRVEVQGIQMNVVAPTNLLIRESGSSDPFSNSVDVTTNPAGKMTHGSSVDGVNVYTLSNPESAIKPEDGSLITANAIVTGAAEVSADEGSYVDFTFEVINTGNEGPVSVGLTDLAISPTDTGTPDISPAVRIAILTDGEANSAGVFALTAKTLQALASADTPVNLGNQMAIDGTVVSGELFEAGTEDAPTTITVRVWIEGQHEDTVTANAGGDFKISFAFVVLDD